MTIPIRPGPFSFLALLGQAGANALEAADKKEAQNKRDSIETIKTMIDLRAKGLLSPEEFGKPEMMPHYRRAGIMPISDKPTSGELSEMDKKKFYAPDQPGFSIPAGLIGGAMDVQVPATGPSAVSDARRRLAGLPTRAQEGIDKTQADVFGPGGAPASQRALSGVTAGPVAAAKEAGQIGEGRTLEANRYEAEADRWIDESIRGRDPRKADFDETVNTAYSTYLADAAANKTAPMEEGAARRYFASALQRKIEKANAEDIARMRAFAYSRGVQDPELQLLDRGIDNDTNGISSLEGEVAKLVAKLPMDPESLRALPGMAAVYGDALTQYDSMMMQIQQLRNHKNGLQKEYERRFGGKFGGTLPARPEVPTSNFGVNVPDNPERAAIIVQRIRANQATLKDAEELMLAGQLSQSDYARIAAAIGGPR